MSNLVVCEYSESADLEDPLLRLWALIRNLGK